MTRLLIVLAATGLLGAGGQALPDRARPLLEVETVVVDGRGNAITDLRRDEIEVRLGDYRIPVDSFKLIESASDAGGREIVLLLDDFTLEPVMAARVRDIARRFVSRMAPGDRMAVVGLNGDAMESTTDRSRILRSIDDYNIRPVGYLPPDDAGAQVLKSVGAIARQLAEVPGRKLIVGIGAAWLFDTPIPPPTTGRDVRREWTEAIRSLSFARVVFYTIDPVGVGQRGFTSGDAGFAHEAGGFAYIGTNDFNGAADRVMRDADRYYLVGFADPPMLRNADIRELTIRVTRPGVSVRARRWIPGTPR